MNDINDRIRQLRLKHGLSMAKFAAIIGVSPGNVGDWEGGKKKTTASAAALIAIAFNFNVSLDWLLTGERKGEAHRQTPPSAALAPEDDWTKAVAYSVHGPAIRELVELALKLPADELNMLRMLAAKLADKEQNGN